MTQPNDITQSRLDCRLEHRARL